MKHSLASLLAAAALLHSWFAAPARAATMILHNFTGGAADGNYPTSALTLSGSLLFGVTSYAGPYGGTSDSGTIFKTNTDGTGFSIVHSFTGCLAMVQNLLAR